MYSARDVTYLAATIYGEARGESMAGKRAVAHVVKNRAEQGGWWGDTIQSVVQKPYQFSAWNDNDPNSPIVKDIAFNFGRKCSEFLDDEVLQDCLCAAIEVLNGHVEDKTDGATHYHARSIHPDWADRLEETVVTGNHVFYK